MSDFQALISKILSDESFRQALIENPEAALKEAGVEPNAEIMEALSGASEESLKELANNFEEDKAAW